MDSALDERFGRAHWFLVVDDETGEMIETLENTARTEASGAGGKAAQLLADKGVGVVVAPEVGPKGLSALTAFGIKAYKQGSAEHVAEALSALNTGTLEEIKQDDGLRMA